MQSVTLKQLKWRDVRAGMTIILNGRKTEVEEIGDTANGHRRVTVDGQTHTMRSTGLATVAEPRY